VLCVPDFFQAMRRVEPVIVAPRQLRDLHHCAMILAPFLERHSPAAKRVLVVFGKSECWLMRVLLHVA
jgi:hypothetical protein